MPLHLQCSFHGIGCICLMEICGRCLEESSGRGVILPLPFLRLFKNLPFMAKIHEPKRCSSQYLLLLLFSCVFVFFLISSNSPVPVNVQCLICYNSPLTQVKNNIPKNDPKPPFQDTPADSKCVLLFFLQQYFLIQYVYCILWWLQRVEYAIKF